MKSSTKRLALAGMMAALSIVLLLLGDLSGILSFMMLAMASFVVLLVMLSAERGYAILHAAAVSLLAFLLLPDKSTALIYLLFAGAYPLFKFKLEKLPPPLSWAVKLFWVNAAAAIIYLLWLFVFCVPDLSTVWWMLLLFAAILNLTFLLYDRALSRFVRLYFDQWEARVSRLLR